MSRGIGIAALLALLLVSPSSAVTAPSSAPLDVMRANVRNIRERGELRRWKDNISLWELVAARPGHPDVATYPAMKPLVDDLSRIAAGLRGPERTRWTANVELWRAMLGHPARYTHREIATMRATLARTSTSDGDLGEPGEHERWEANRTLWRSRIEALAH